MQSRCQPIVPLSLSLSFFLNHLQYFILIMIIRIIIIIIIVFIIISAQVESLF